MNNNEVVNKIESAIKANVVYTDEMILDRIKKLTDMYEETESRWGSFVVSDIVFLLKANGIYIDQR